MTTDPRHPPVGATGGTGTPPQEPPAAGPGPQRPTPGLAFFNRLRAMGLVRRNENKLIAGVCTGISQRYGVDLLLVRGIFFVLLVIGGFGAGLYGLAWLLLPHPDGRIHAEGALHGVFTAGFFGSALLLLVDLGNGIGHTWAPFWGGGWGPPHPLPFLIALAAIWWLVTQYGTRRGQGGQHQPGGGPGYPPYGGGVAPGDPGGTASGAPGVTVAGPAAPADASGGTASVPVTPYGTPPGATTGQYPEPAYGTAPGTPYGGMPGGAVPPGPQGAASPGGPGTATHPTTRMYPTTATGLVPPPRLDLHAPSHPLTRGVLGLALVGAAATVLWDHLVEPLPAHAGAVALGVALAIVALGVIVAGLLGRRAGGLAPIAVLLALLSIGAAVGHGVQGQLGTHSWRPASASTAADGYTLGAGDATIDLTQPGLTAGRSAADPVDIPVQLGVGRVRILVPAGTSVEIDASIGVGNIVDDVNGTRTDSSGGAGVKRVVHAYGDSPVIVVRVNVGLGSVEIESRGQVVAP